MSLRDDLLPVADQLRAIPAGFGLRRFATTIRRRVWSGPQAGDGVPTVQDLPILPPPRVVALPSTDRQVIDILVTGSYATLELYKIGPITPKYAGGGYTPAQLKAKRNAETMNIEPFVMLVGDDGFARECVQVFLSDDRALRYSMIVQKTERKAVQISSIVVSAPSFLDMGKSSTLQVTASGVFEDGTHCDVTPLVAWSVSDPRVAAIDSIGTITAVVAGLVQVTALFRGIESAPVPVQVIL